MSSFLIKLILIKIIQLTNSELRLRSPERNSLARVVLLRHLHKHASLGEDLIDRIPLGSDDVLVLALLHLNAYLAEFADLENIFGRLLKLPI